MTNPMRKLSILVLSLTLGLSGTALGQQKKKPAKPKAAAAPAVKYNPPAAPTNSALKAQLSQALKMAQSGQYLNAANVLFSLSRRVELQADRPQIKYILGLMLMELKLNQVAAFQFVDVIRMNNPKYTKQAIEKLSIVADTLGDDTILNYAISRVDINDFPAGRRDMIYFRLGEIKMKGREFGKAADLFGRVVPGSTYYYQSAFAKGLAELEGKQPNLALGTFQRMLDNRSGVSVTDTNRVAAQMAIARSLYQKQDWEAAIEAYSQVPRDTLMWHDAVFEQAWAMLRAARFRSALSNFQTLHSQYYEDFYMPESLLLRAIVYLYICKYDEMEKVLGLFEKTYGPVRRQITDFSRSGADAMAYYNEIEKANAMKRTDKSMNLRLPFLVTRNVLEEGDIKRALTYLRKLGDERERVEANSAFRISPIGQYAVKILTNRTRNSKIAVGEMVKSHLQSMRAELKDLYEQAGFIRYEMINGKKEVLKKKITNKDVSNDQIDDRIDRKFYIQNGYEYYPFQGEYWLDEIGNYHYLGKQSCE
jgi:tetratricopeptide (TPR) repeat protein